MNIKNKLRDLKDQMSYSIPAKRVMDHLQPILSKSNDLRQRWIWELLQNASDLGNNIKARFELNADRLKFSHNGNPFSLDEAYNLIMPNSTKDEETTNKKSVIGKFGTGFISTHILSRIIQIEGIIKDDKQLYSFNFHLDRSKRNDKDFLIQSIKESEAQYQGNLEEIDNLPINEIQTSFTYQIDKTYSSLKGGEIVNAGINSLKELIPYVLSFRPQLAEIEVIDKRFIKTELTYKRVELECDIQDLKIIKTISQKNGKHIEDSLIGVIIEHTTEIAFPIKKIDKNKFQLLSYPENCPLLFCAFPMIGTSDFNFPVIINSEKFLPNRERDGVEISNFDAENRDRLKEAKVAFLRLLEIIEEYEWTDAFNISFIKAPQFNEFSTKNWFTNTIFKPIKEGLHKTKMVELDESLKTENKRLSLSEIYIPYADRRLKNYTELATDIYNFAFKTIPTILPKREHILNWFEILDFEIFTGEKLDLETLTNRIFENIETLEQFCSEYYMDDTKAIDFLIEFLKFILSQDKKQLLNDYKLILNQSLQFCFLKGIRLDQIYHKGLKDGCDEKLKDIYHTLSKTDCRAVLMHKEFEQIEVLIDKDNSYQFKELAKNTDEALRIFDGNFHYEHFLKTLKDLFNWYTTCGLSDEILVNLFPYFSLNKSQLYLNTKTPQELEFAFDIEISGKSEVLAKLANTSLSENQLEIIADNPELVTNFIEWLNSKQKDDPDKELGNIGEEFLYHQLCQKFGENRVLWEDKSEYDFRVLEKDETTTKYFIDAKTTGKGIANRDNVPFFMRTAQWSFLDKKQASDKYIIARVFKNGETFDVKYLRLNKESF
jgi:hypothetical protein